MVIPALFAMGRVHGCSYYWMYSHDRIRVIAPEVKRQSESGVSKVASSIRYHCHDVITAGKEKNEAVATSTAS